jgi:hypothetical protein
MPCTVALTTPLALVFTAATYLVAVVPPYSQPQPFGAIAPAAVSYDSLPSVKCCGPLYTGRAPYLQRACQPTNPSKQGIFATYRTVQRHYWSIG